MKKRFTIIGFGLGFAAGILAVFFLPGGATPTVFRETSLSLAQSLNYAAGQDPMVAFLFMIPIAVIMFAGVGGVAGFAVGAIVAMIQRKNSRAKLPPGFGTKEF